MKKTVILGNQAAAVAGFWLPLIRRLREKGEPLAVVPFPETERDREAASRLAEAGATLRWYPLERKGLNPLHDMRSLMALFSIFRAEAPDVVFSTTIKPVIWGNFAARMAGVPHRYSMITGLGFAFEGDTPVKRALTKLASTLYRRALAGASGVFFQNKADEETFFRLNIVKADAPTRLFSSGTGVDTLRFAPVPLPEGAPVFLMVARLLEAKGIREYAQAAAILKARHPEARFLLLGPPETGPGAISADEVKAFEAVDYVGEAADVRPWIARASVLALPSWREGVPCSLMEGMAMGRCAVATDVPGCRDLVQEGENGLLAKVRNPESLAAVMERLITEPGLVAALGNKARALMVERYDARHTANAIAEAMGL